MNLHQRTKTDKINTVIEDNKMSRTYRKTDGMHRYAYRFPHTFNEIRNLDGILNDDELQDYPVSGMNHMRSRESNLPTAWDDKVVSAYYQEDYKVS